MSGKKILVNGCGMTFGRESIKSWPDVLTAVGVDIVDLSAPAVSNQWIVDRTAEYLLTHTDIAAVVLQLTNIDKLDVEVNDARLRELVESDTIRNFTWQGIWPSSSSLDHPSKQLYSRHLYSPGLLTKELAVKLALLSFWCQQHQIELLVYQGYNIPWNSTDLDLINSLILNLDQPWAVEYKNSEFYKHHDFSNHNTVPGIEYAFYLATKIAQQLELPVAEKLDRLAQAYANKYFKPE